MKIISYQELVFNEDMQVQKGHELQCQKILFNSINVNFKKSTR